MTSTNDLRNGMPLLFDGQIFTVVEFQHVKPGKGGAFVRTKLKNLKSGAVIERTFRSGEKVEEVRLEDEEVEYLYASGDQLHCMNTETYDQLEIPGSLLGDSREFLKENTRIRVLFRESEPITAELPNFVELTVSETAPGVRGDTASGGSKPATLETGAVIQVPLFIEPGTRVKVDTRDGRYIERV